MPLKLCCSQDQHCHWLFSYRKYHASPMMNILWPLLSKSQYVFFYFIQSSYLLFIIFTMIVKIWNILDEFMGIQNCLQTWHIVWTRFSLWLLIPKTTEPKFWKSLFFQNFPMKPQQVAITIFLNCVVWYSFSSTYSQNWLHPLISKLKNRFSSQDI